MGYVGGLHGLGVFSWWCGRVECGDLWRLWGLVARAVHSEGGKVRPQIIAHIAFGPITVYSRPSSSKPELLASVVRCLGLLAHPGVRKGFSEPCPSPPVESKRSQKDSGFLSNWIIYRLKLPCEDRTTDTSVTILGGDRHASVPSGQGSIYML